MELREYRDVGTYSLGNIEMWEYRSGNRALRICSCGDI